MTLNRYAGVPVLLDHCNDGQNLPFFARDLHALGSDHDMIRHAEARPFDATGRAQAPDRRDLTELRGQPFVSPGAAQTQLTLLYRKVLETQPSEVPHHPP